MLVFELERLFVESILSEEERVLDEVDFEAYEF